MNIIYINFPRMSFNKNNKQENQYLIFIPVYRDKLSQLTNTQDQALLLKLHANPYFCKSERTGCKDIIYGQYTFQ